MSNKSLEEIKNIVAQRVSKKRFEHICSVSKTALEIFAAIKDSLNTEQKKQIVSEDNFIYKLEMAGFLHDSCKELKNEDQIALANFYQIKIYPEDHEIPNLLHARVAAKWIEDEFEILDQHIIKAVEEHTLAGENMFLTAQIIFLADMVEPLRPENPSLTKIRKLIFEDHDIDLALKTALDEKIQYQIKKSQKIHPLAISARNKILEKKTT